MLARILFVCSLAAFLSVKTEAHRDSDRDFGDSYAPVAPMNATSTANNWLTRTETEYQLLARDPDSGTVSVQQIWNIQRVDDRIKKSIDHGRYKRDEKALKHYMHRLERVNGGWHRFHANRSGHEDHKHHEHKQPRPMELNEFYIQHAQCRACVSNNLDILTSSGWGERYQPARIMKWCPFVEPRLKAEISPLQSGLSLQDFEGYCVEATRSCPMQSIDMNILDLSRCNNDEPATKLSCALCTTDSYAWLASRHALRRFDNYDGLCVDPSVVAASSFTSGTSVICSLDSCPASSVSVPMDFDAAGEFFYFVAVKYFFIILFISLIGTCCVRNLRNKARLEALRRSSQQLYSVPIPGPVITHASAPPEPVSDLYPAQAHQQQQDFVEPLLPSYYMPAYPIVQHPQQPQQY